jgi:hypothetical protein
MLRMLRRMLSNVGAHSRTIRCGDDVEVLCGCVSGRPRRSGRDVGGKAVLRYGCGRETSSTIIRFQGFKY